MRPTSAEIDYVLALVQTTRLQRALTWRGYQFSEQQTDRLAYETLRVPGRYGSPHAIAIAWWPTRPSGIEWVGRCLLSINQPYPQWTINPIDGVPPEIHAIEDFHAYVSALAAYQAERSALTG